MLRLDTSSRIFVFKKENNRKGILKSESKNGIIENNLLNLVYNKLYYGDKRYFRNQNDSLF